MRIQEREGLCLDLLRKLPQRFVLIGGYATSSFDFPRFSVDLDLVIQKKDNRVFAEALEKEGFVLAKVVGHFSKYYEGCIIRFQRRVDDFPVSVDLFVEMVQAWQTGAAYSYAYIRRNSETRRVFGSGTREKAETKVADREMLIALKINSMRMADQRDIIALCSGTVNSSKIIAHLKRAPRDKIESHLDIISAALESPEAKDSLKGVFGISDRVYDRVMDRARKEIRSIRRGLAS